MQRAQSEKCQRSAGKPAAHPRAKLRGRTGESSAPTPHHQQANPGSTALHTQLLTSIFIADELIPCANLKIKVGLLDLIQKPNLDY